MAYRKGESGNPNGRPKKNETFKSYYDKWSKKIRKKFNDIDGGKTVTGKECIVITLLKMIQNDETPDNIKLQAIKLILEYTESKPTPEAVTNVTVKNIQQRDNYLRDVKQRLDKLSPEERELFLSINEKLKND